MNIPFEQIVRMFIAEAFKYRKLLLCGFVLVNIAVVLTGLFSPKLYTTSTKILVDNSNIIQPLMQGAAVTTEVADRARIAKEVIYSRKMLLALINFANSIEAEPVVTTEPVAPALLINNDIDEKSMTQGEEETAIVSSNEQSVMNMDERRKIAEQIEKMKARIEVAGVNTGGGGSSQSRSILNLSYKDPDPNLSFEITKRLAELFISESLEGKAEESRAAYEFIDQQVKEYHEKLTKAEQDLKEFRVSNIDTHPGSEDQIGNRINTFRQRIEQTQQELREARIRRSALSRQLSGEAEATAEFTREGQYRQRIGELKSQLATLRLNFHETYPDIVRIKHQIADLKNSILEERKSTKESKNSATSNNIRIDEGVLGNPVYQELRRQMADTRILVATLEGRLKDTENQFSAELERAKRVHGGEATLAELTRDYQVNRDIYQDLLRRRENARVSMNLDREERGLSLKIFEPASFPVQPSGPRFWYFLAGGPVLGVLLPLGVLYMFVTTDPRIRYSHIISNKLGLPVLATIPHLVGVEEEQSIASNTKIISVVLVFNVIFLGVAISLRLFVLV